MANSKPFTNNTRYSTIIRTHKQVLEFIYIYIYTHDVISLVVMFVVVVVVVAAAVVVVVVVVVV